MPAFESVQTLSPLLSKKELLDLWNSDTVQPFYYQACWKCQKHLDYESWKRYRHVGKHQSYVLLFCKSTYNNDTKRDVSLFYRKRNAVGTDTVRVKCFHNFFELSQMFSIISITRNRSFEKSFFFSLC